MENQMFNDKAQNDALIVEQVQKGNSQAYNLLVIKYQHKIRDVALKFTNNQADASDIAQEAFIKAYRAIGSFRGECSFYTWIYRITVNTAKSFLESNSKHRYAVDVDAPEFESQDTQGVLTSNESPDRLIESDELKRVIFKALNELPCDLKQAIMLREIEGKSYDEIAEIMKTPIGTVRSRIFRARQFIEEQMAKISGN
ncbi:sigma-70 family RNA polymerase sigma factor [Succinatimonas hippei]|uniref:sigma-70 family RNA polymerase sigma factor n=1 Tax=Succinatimonas hippei TaxID=626938 RepID=UPI0025A34EA3|nr:sigma-70 family RNA polymerase sigma factor [Succinatimonas hippei]MDM8119760.1 sigma-70 family RNA polymerase sigma factor [Succinatimonas hippei]